MRRIRVKTTSHKDIAISWTRNTATPVACGWAGAVFEVTRVAVVRLKTTNCHETDVSMKMAKKQKKNSGTERRFDGQTDQQSRV